MATLQPVLPVLPADVWRIVFGEITEDHDLAHLWTECRNVSNLFADEVEHVFKTKHLPKTSIAFDLGSIFCISDNAEEDRDNILPGNKRVDLSGIQFDLDRFTHNERIAIYKLREGCVAKDSVCKVFERLPFGIPTLSRPDISRRQRFINILRAVNGTKVPSLAFDSEKEELSLDWRGMYTNFYAKEKIFGKNQEYLLDTQGKPYAERVRARIESGESRFTDKSHEQHELSSNAGREIRLLARCDHLQHQWRDYRRYMEVLNKDVEKSEETVTESKDEHEMATLKKLNSMRCFLDWLAFGDHNEATAESNEDDEESDDDDDEDEDDEESDDDDDEDEDDEESDDEDDEDEDDEDDDEVDDKHADATSKQTKEAGKDSPSN